MSRSLLLIFLFYFSLIISSSAQENGFITGKVLDSENGLPAHDVSILFFSQKNVVYRTSSDSLGIFKASIRFTDGLDSIKFTSFTYKTYVIRKQQGEDLYKNGSFGVFKLNPAIVELNEVKIKANKRYRDTTKIDLLGQKFERSVMIDDMFSTNGFSKDANGQLFYKGKPVSDVLVNGGDFFGKNNKDVYNLLPALALSDIEIVETNIDSTTNTTTLRPTIKVNLKFKEQYKKGKFGNASAGLGTEERYLAGVGLYAYKNKEQISLTGNSNNINIRDIPLADPAITFSANSNNVDAKNIKLTYNNIVAKKLQIDVSANGKTENRDFTSESERQEQSINQYSKTTNKSNSKLKGITDARVRLNYKIDSLNTVQLTQVNNYNQIIVADSLNYIIKFDSSAAVISNLSRRQKIINSSSATDIAYKKLFASKKGRSFSLGLNQTNILNKNDELDNIYNFSAAGLKTYYVDGKRKSNTHIYTLSASFTEPITEDSYINVFSSYKNDKINYFSNLVSDSLTNFLNAPIIINNRFIRAGAQYHKTYNKVSFDGTALLLYNTRNSLSDNQINYKSFLNVDADINAEYRMNRLQDFTFLYNVKTNYPELSQLVNFNNSYDLISQMSGNLNLKPEIKNSVKILFNSRKESGGGYNLNGEFDYYMSKIATNINTEQSGPQNIFYDNIGHAISANVGFSFYKNSTTAFNLNYNNSLSYQQQPIIVDKKINVNSGITFNQVISTTKQFFNNTLYVSPVITTSYTKFYYESSTINMITLSYSDKVSLMVAKFKIDLYPLVNYSHSINSLTSLSMNAGIKRTVFGTTTLWFQGYDIFNSFKFNNSILNAAYTQTIKYSNVSRYFILGLSFKFNDIK